MLRLLLLPLLALSACNSVSPFADVEAVPVNAGDVAEARARWEASGTESYTMTLERSCFCGQEALGPFKVRVDAGETVSVRRGGRTVERSLGRNVTDLFDLLDDALAEDAASVRAAFDPERGYPLRLSIDYNELMADEEIGYTVTRLSGG